MRMMLPNAPTALLSFVVVIGAAGCPIPDAPAALNPFPQSVPANATALVGVTNAGVGRARINSHVDLGNGLVGVRAKISRDGGTTFSERQPASRYFPDGTVVLDNLAAGDSLLVALVSVSNIGIESDVAQYGAPTAVDIPLTNDNVNVPASPTPNVFLTPSGAALTWPDTSGDTFGYHVEKSVDAGPFSAIGGTVLATNTPGFFDPDVPSGHSYQWQITAENISGNLSTPGQTNTVGVP